MIAPFVASRNRTYRRLRRNNIPYDFQQDPESRSPPVRKKTAAHLRGELPEDAGEMRPSSKNAASEQRLSSPPASPRVYEGVPLAERVCVTIRPNDERFVEAEAYFNKLLRSDRLSMQEILDMHFSKHEVDKFVPTNRDPVRQWQAENTVQFESILKSQFRGKLPTLACKMAMHWFGLPVAPMKLLSGKTLQAYDFGRSYQREHPEETDAEEDPLAFLDDQEGDPECRLAGIAPGHSDPTLRGGHLDADAMDIILSDIEEDAASELWERQASDQLTVSLRGGVLTYDQLALHVEEMGNIAKSPNRQQELVMYGRQGYTSHQPSWAGFVDAVRYLLPGATQQHGLVLIAVDLFEFGRRGDGKQGWNFVGTLEGPLLLDTKENSKDDTIMEFVTANMNLSHAREEKRVCYVRLARDLRPDSPTPEGDGQVELVHEEGGARRGAYLRIPSVPSEEHTPSQYFDEFRKAIHNLLPGSHYSIDLRLIRGDAPVDPAPTGIMYVGDDPRPVFASLVSRAHKALRDAGSKSLVRFTVACAPENPDFLWLLSPRHRAIGTYPKSDLSDLDALLAAAARHFVPNASVGKSVGHFEFWMPAQAFSEDMRTPFILEYADGRPSPRSREAWRLYVEGMKRVNPDIFTAGFSIMIRPIYRQYRLVGKQDSKRILHILKNLLSLDLQAFKALVATHLYPQLYDPFDRSQVLILRGLAAQHVVRYDSTDRDWHRIRRRFTESEIGVELKLGDKTKWERDTRWDVDPSSYWGPCYDPPEELQPDRVLAATLNSMTTTTAEPSTSAGGNAKSRDTKPRANMEELKPETNTFALNKNMREQTVWKVPSIFANPFKPTMPIHAAPVENLLKVGTRVPTVTLAMRTPTEMFRLQNEVHTLRGQMLDRIRECPYADCDQFFAYGEVEALDRHLKQDHTILRCPLCSVVGKKQVSDSLFFADPDRALRHFHEQHLDQVLKLAQVPTGANVPGQVTGNELGLPAAATGYNYCHRCGRDHIACNLKPDRMHHAKQCKNLDNASSVGVTASSPDFCPYCGVLRHKHSCDNPRCFVENKGVQYCSICGVFFQGWSKLHQAQHSTGCRPPGGKTADFCGYCGTSLRDLETPDKERHGLSCKIRNGSAKNGSAAKPLRSGPGDKGHPPGNTGNTGGGDPSGGSPPGGSGSPPGGGGSPPGGGGSPRGGSGSPPGGSGPPTGGSPPSSSGSSGGSLSGSSGSSGGSLSDSSGSSGGSPPGGRGSSGGSPPGGGSPGGGSPPGGGGPSGGSPPGGGDPSGGSPPGGGGPSGRSPPGGGSPGGSSPPGGGGPSGGSPPGGGSPGGGSPPGGGDPSGGSPPGGGSPGGGSPSGGSPPGGGSGPSGGSASGGGGPTGSTAAGAHLAFPPHSAKKPKNNAKGDNTSQTTQRPVTKRPITQVPATEVSEASQDEKDGFDYLYSDELSDDNMYEEMMAQDGSLGVLGPTATEPDANQQSKKRKRLGRSTADPKYRRGFPQDEPEEEVDDRTGHRDGAAEDFSIMRPGMKEIPGIWKSPVEINFPKRSRTSTLKLSTGVTDEPAQKRAKKTATSSREGTPAPATRESSRLAGARAASGGESSKKPTSGKKPAPSKPAATELPPLPPLPGRGELPAPPTITRKSGRISRKTVRLGEEKPAGNADEAASGTATPPGNAIEVGMAAAKALAKAAVKKPAVKKPAVKTPAKRGRKKGTFEEVNE